MEFINQYWPLLIPLNSDSVGSDGLLSDRSVAPGTCKRAEVDVGIINNFW